MPNVKPRNMERSQTWRARGKVYRAQIVLEDEQKGGNAFVLSNQCSIDRYYRVAEKVGNSCCWVVVVVGMSECWLPNANVGLFVGWLVSSGSGSVFVD